MVDTLAAGVTKLPLVSFPGFMRFLRLLVASQGAVGESTEAPPDDDSPSVRFWLRHDQVIAFSKQAESVLSAGRPLCPRCGLPMDPAGHPCPVMNGARPIF